MKPKSNTYTSIVFILLFTTGIVNLSIAQNLTGSWSFSGITNAQNEVVKPSKETDSLFLDREKFHYYIDTLNLKAEGTYWYYSDTLNFRYTQPTDTLRSYWIKSWSDSAFTLQEGHVFYHFSKQVPKYSNVNKTDKKWYKSVWIYVLSIGLVLIFIRWTKTKKG